MTNSASFQFIAPFNGPIEIGLRTLAVLTESYPAAYSIQRLVVFDYLVVHSDDVLDGPTGLHPKTPHRSGELLVRRSGLQEGLLLYESRGLVQRHFEAGGILYSATERSAAFLDTLTVAYVPLLRERAMWVINTYGHEEMPTIEEFVRTHIGEWGAEFEFESVLWQEDSR